MRLTHMILMLGIVLSLGCSSSDLQRAEVSGTVKLNGKLVEEGAISFVPVEGNKGPQAGAIIKNGQYHIPRSKGPIVGKNRVELRAFKLSSQKMQDPTKPQGVLTHVRVPAFPPEYNDNSTLVREITPDDNTLNFDIEVKETEK